MQHRFGIMGITATHHVFLLSQWSIDMLHPWPSCYCCKLLGHIILCNHRKPNTVHLPHTHGCFIWVWWSRLFAFFITQGVPIVTANQAHRSVGVPQAGRTVLFLHVVDWIRGTPSPMDVGIDLWITVWPTDAVVKMTRNTEGDGVSSPQCITNNVILQP